MVEVMVAAVAVGTTAADLVAQGARVAAGTVEATEVHVEAAVLAVGLVVDRTEEEGSAAEVRAPLSCIPLSWAR